MEHEKIFDEHYFLLRLLGRSMYSEVWLAHDEFANMDVALKIYSPSSGLNDEGLKIFAKEFSMITKSNHENLLSPIHYGQYNRQPYLVFPYCSNGSVAKRVGLFKETEIWKFIYDVASGLEVLHGKKPPIIHQNIKPNNILVSDNGSYMLTDYYLSPLCKDTLRKVTARVLPVASSAAYIAPESIGANMPIMAGDIYSLGVVTFELMTGSVYWGKDGDLIHKDNLDMSRLSDKFSSDLKNIVQQCLSKSPWERPSANELVRFAEKKSNGDEIQLVTEKGNNRKLITFLILCGLLFTLVVCWTISHNGQVRREKVAMEIAQTDSIRKMVFQQLENANMLCRRAIAKEESYDSLLIKAHQEYMKALCVINESSSKRILNLKNVAEAGLAIVERQLQAAYKEMKEKAEYFKDDPAVKMEFENRASNIAITLNKKR